MELYYHPSVKTVLFANPTAQSGNAAGLIAEARALMKLSGIAHSFVATLPGGKTVGLVRRAIDEDGVRRVVYMGGDGTFAEVAKGILASRHTRDVALGMLPTGTANDQGKSFGLDAGLDAMARNVEVIAKGRVRSIDVGRIERLDGADQPTHGDYFFDSASVGFGASTLVMRNRDREAVARIPLVRELYRDHLVYAGALVKQLLGSYASQVKFDLEAVIDGRVHRYKSLLDVIIKNTSVYGGEWILAPDSEPDDGLLEMIPIAGRRDLTSKLLATLRHSPVNEDDLRKLGIEHSRPERGAHFELTVLQPGVSEPPSAQIDGEEFAAGDRFRITVLPRALPVIVPPGA